MHNDLRSLHTNGQIGRVDSTDTRSSPDFKPLSAAPGSTRHGAGGGSPSHFNKRRGLEVVEHQAREDRVKEIAFNQLVMTDIHDYL